MTDTQMRLRLALRNVDEAARKVVAEIPNRPLNLYGIPRGGVPAALAVASAMHLRGYVIALLDSEHDADPQSTLIVDDIYDSGATLKPWLDKGFSCAALFAKRPLNLPGPNDKHRLYVGATIPESVWAVFPWETDNEEAGPADAVRRLLQYIGEDPDDPHLQETPRRVLAWFDMFRRRDPDFVATTFEGVDYDGMVMVRRIPFVSLCAHHLIPFAGHAAVAYIPEARTHETPKPVIGLSKLARFVQHYASRLQNQEQLTTQIRDAVAEATLAESVAVRISAEHMCMNFRGPRVPGAETVTSSLMGAFRTDPKAREEFYSLAGER